MSFTGINGGYECAYPLIPEIAPVMVMFLGSSIGNFDEAAEHSFWSSMSGCLTAGDFFLLGVDLVKDRETLEAAYNDRAGVSAAFTKNLFARMNREFDSGLDLDLIEHVATYSEEHRQVEIRALFRGDQKIRVKPEGKSFPVEAGEEINTEVSRKFVAEELLDRMATHGFEAVRTFTDSTNRFALILSRRTDADG